MNDVAGLAKSRVQLICDFVDRYSVTYLRYLLKHSFEIRKQVLDEIEIRIHRN